MIIGTALGWSNWQTIALSVVLAFFFGYSLTMLPLMRAALAATPATIDEAREATTSSTIATSAPATMLLMSAPRLRCSRRGASASK
jgi:Domain of unknown function (DUF4396)